MNLRRVFVSFALSAAAVSLCPLTASAQVKPQTLVKQRQAVMTLQSKYFYGSLRRMAQGRLPYDAKIAARDATYLQALSTMAWDGFTPGTRDVKSEALPAVFTDTAKFRQAQERLESEAGKLVAATKSGDEATVKAQIMSVDKACDSCHESFREKK
jgi:cytochrome c556